MISKKLLEQMSQRDREMVEMFQMVFNEDELNLITKVFTVEKLAIFMKLASIMSATGRKAGLSIIGIILDTLIQQGTLSVFFAEANSFKPTNVSTSVN